MQVFSVRFGAAVVENGRSFLAVLVRLLWCCGVGCAELKEIKCKWKRLKVKRSSLKKAACALLRRSVWRIQ